ncbi:MAG: cation:proton antiporter, partial [Burkholderiaceae bacterium]|nr:cation:proton antiporter [Burkholderiaceae bacterium]
MEFLPSWPLSVNTLFFFGFLLFCGSLGGYAAHRFPWLPSITGFMVVGLVAGPNVLGLITPEALAGSRIVVDVALALILYRLGLSLDIKRIVNDRSLVVVSLVESALTFAAVYFCLGWFGISGLVAAVIATIAISSSPAVLIHVAHELGASGPVTDRSMSLVALNNVIAFMAFAAVLPALYGKAAAPLFVIIGAPLYQVLGSAALGSIMGWALHWAARKTKAAHQYQLALVIGAVMMTVGAALVLNLSALFAPLVLGMVVRSLERTNLVADIEFGPSFELFFIVLFVYAGANMHVAEMLQYWPAALAFVVARSGAKWLGVTLAATALGTPVRQAASSGLLLMPMAGLAIGLVNTTVALFPQEGLVVGSMVLAAVAILETVGPPIAARALRWSGDRLDEQDDSGDISCTSVTSDSDDTSRAKPTSMQTGPM